MHYPHSINQNGAGQMQSQVILPSDAANLTAWDANPFCDPFFGDPGSPECQASPAGSDVCSEAGLIGEPSPIGVPEYSHAFVKRGAGPVLYPPPVFDGAEWTCRSSWPTQANCFVGQATCAVASITDVVHVKGGSSGLALAACQADAVVAPFQGPWLVESIYFPSGGLSGPIPGCFKVKVYEHTPAGYCD